MGITEIAVSTIVCVPPETDDEAQHSAKRGTTASGGIRKYIRCDTGESDKPYYMKSCDQKNLLSKRICENYVSARKNNG